MVSIDQLYNNSIPDNFLFDKSTIPDVQEKNFVMAVKILIALREKNVTKMQLAERISVTDIYINQVVKGLVGVEESIVQKIEKELDVILINSL